LLPADPYFQRAPAEWTGAALVMQKWLARQSSSEAMLNLGGGVLFFIFGFAALVLTSCIGAGVAVFIVFEAGLLASAFGISLAPAREVLFALFFLVFLGMTIRYAYVTRKGTDGPATIDLDLALGLGLFLEFISAGPIMLVLAMQEFYRYYRLTRMDIPQVSSLLVWIYDREGRASFADICMAFPGLNAVRVLPQLRDIPGLNWWPDDAELSLADDIMDKFTELLGRKPKSSPFGSRQSYERPRAEKPPPGIDPKIVAWYKTLDLPLFANFQEVKKRYRKLAKIYHPDLQTGKTPADKLASSEQMKRINEAYHNILDLSQSQAGAAS
jgi:hypothetical protein